MHPCPVLSLGLITLLLGAPVPVGAHTTAEEATPAVAGGDIAGPVEIGSGRRLWLVCRGEGSPTVIFEAGAGHSSAVWDAVALPPESGQTAVLPGVAAFTRVCAYDRPGTMVDADHRGRSDPVPMPRTAADAVADLHALLKAAEGPGPYILVGQSFGGVIVRLYAATYPDKVAGLVLVNSAHEEQSARLEAALGAENWAAYERLQQAPPELERMDLDASFAQLRSATAA
jgi:pimeloyl-ACP methyl ester carboxylesterase